MSKKTKKIFALVLACAMIVGILPADAYFVKDVMAAGTDSLVVHYDMSHEDGELINQVEGYEQLNGNLVDLDTDNFFEYGNTKALHLNGGGYVELPSGIINGEKLTVSITVSNTVSNNQWLWAFGTSSWDYTFLTPSNGSGQVKYTIASQTPYDGTGAWAKEETIATKTSAYLDGKYATYTVVIDGSKTYLYIDGSYIGEQNKTHNLMSIIPDSGTIGYIGRSFYSGDPLFNGTVTDMKIYQDALSADQVQDTVAADDDLEKYLRTDIAYTMLSENESLDNVTEDLNLVSSVNGTAVTWAIPEDQQVLSDEGKVSIYYGEEDVKVTAAYTFNGQEYTADFDLTLKSKPEIVASYNMTRTEDGEYLADVTGHGFDAKVVNTSDSDFEKVGAGTVWNMDGQRADAPYAMLPNGLVAADEFSIYVKAKATVNQYQFLWCLGTKEGTDANSVGANIFLNPIDKYGFLRAGIKNIGNTEELFATPSKLQLDKYYGLTMTSKDNKLTLYINGEVESVLEPGYTVQSVLDAIDDDFLGYIGKALWPDEGFTGVLSEMKVYNYALDQEEIEIMTSTQTHERIVEELTIQNMDDVRGSITLPTELDGAIIEWVSPDGSADGVIDLEEKENEGYDNAPIGVVTRPEDGDKTVNLTAKVYYGIDLLTKDFTLTVKQASGITASDYEGYFFPYFSGEGSLDGEQIFFATSEDGLFWDDLNGNDPVITSDKGEEGVRDPFIIRAPEGDKFYMIATDLRIASGRGWEAAQKRGSQSIMIWESNDLVNWTDQRMEKVALDAAGCTWAPEAYYDKETEEYIVFWASQVSTDNYAQHRVYYSKTRDFYTFTEPEVMIEKNNTSTGTKSVIDTTIIEHDGYYYRYSKNEQNGNNIFVDRVDKLLSSDVEIFKTLSEYGGVEGPTIFKFNDGQFDEETWCLLLDNYGSGGYYPVITTDLTFQDTSKYYRLNSSQYKMPSRARHGTAIPVTAEEYQALNDTWLDVTPTDRSDEAEVKEPILEYDFEAVNDRMITDVSGNGYDAKLWGNAAIAADSDLDDSNVLVLDGSVGTYLELPRGMFDGRDTFTIQMDIKSQMSNNKNEFMAFVIGKSQYKNFYLRNREKSLTGAVLSVAAGTSSPWNYEKGATYSTTLPLDTWYSIGMVVDGNTIQVFYNGEKVAENTNITEKVSGLGANLVSYIGRSVYNADYYLNGSVDNVKVYNRALSEEEMAGIELPETDKTALEITIDYAKKQKENYPANLIESIRILFETALDDAIRVYDNPYASQEEIDEADEALITMIHYLSFTADYASLAAAVNYAQTLIDSGDYEEDDAFDAYVLLVNEAKAMIQAGDDTDTEIGKMLADLAEAETKLTIKSGTELNLKRLLSEIEQAEILVAQLDEYLDEGKADFLEALKDAKDAAVNATAQEEINAAAIALREARLKLRLRPSKEKLGELIDIARGYKAEGYTPASFAVLQSAIIFAEEVYANPNASDIQIAEAQERLTNGIHGLEEIGDETDPTGETESDTTGETESDTTEETGTPQTNETEESDQTGQSDSSDGGDGSEGSDASTESDSGNKAAGSDGKKGAGGKSKVKTGDTASVVVTIMLGMCSMAILLLFAVKRRKSN